MASSQSQGESVTTSPATGDAASAPAQREDPHAVKNNVQLSLVILGLWLSMFLCSLDTTIVSTALVHIGNDLSDLEDAAWIVVAYLLTFNAFILIWSKLSDTFGTKWLLLTTNGIFCVFSIGCALSKTMVQLIIFRALQGVGGSGMYSLTFVVLAQITPMDKLGLTTGVLSSVFALANLLGPILGGVISDNTTWRWIFWLNVPGIAVTLALLIVFMPNQRSQEQLKQLLKNMDIVGAFLALVWAILLVFALEEGGKSTGYKWSSGVIIGTLVAGIATLFIFAAWQWWAYKHTNVDCLFPVALLKRPVVVLLFLSLFLLGFTFYVPIIETPQRFQYVNGTTATRAGILLLPLTLISPTIAMLAGSMMGKHRLAPPIVIGLGVCVNLLGIVLMGTLPTSSDVPNAQYGYQVLIGASIGLLTPSLLYLLKLLVPPEQLAGAMGAGNMGRTLGGCIGLAVYGSVLQSHLEKVLPDFLTEDQIEAIAASSSAAAKLLTPVQQAEVAEAYGEAFNLAFYSLCAFSGLSVVVAALLCLYYLRWMKENPEAFADAVQGTGQTVEQSQEAGEKGRSGGQPTSSETVTDES